MALRGVLGAALAGIAARAHVSASADAASAPMSPPPPPQIAPPTAKRPTPPSEVDVARAVAIMERYQRMSRDALRANAPEAAVPEIGIAAAAAEGEASSPTAAAAPPSEQKAATAATEDKGGVKRAVQTKTPRTSAERLFGDFEAAGDTCVAHVIVGGGTAAWSAIQAIRRRDPSAAILLITEEEAFPYNRTPLSKELWAPGAAGLFTSERGTRTAVEYSYAAVEGEGAPPAPVSILRGKAVVALDIDAKTVTVADGRVVQYGKLLLATGGVPRAAGSVCCALESDGVAAAVSVFRTLADFRELRSTLGPPGSSVTVVGGGFLGTELAVAMASEGRRVTLLCAEPGVLYNVLPRYLSQFLSRRLASVGVKVVESAVVTDARLVEGGRVALALGGGVDECTLEPTDRVVVATGVVPRVELAERAGLEIDQRNGGVVVNDQMNAEADVYVAGDVASFWDRALGRRRTEHWGEWRDASSSLRRSLRRVCALVL
jgi:NADPH-dependent 2,4-dienoyl-CoA reductase/sulfur reductase-like enzyme